MFTRSWNVLCSAGICGLLLLSGAHVWGEEPAGILTLPDAVAVTLINNPELAAFSLDIRAAEAREIQASLRPNPTLSLEVEDLRLSKGSASSTTTRTAGISKDGVSGSFDHTRESGAAAGFAESQITLSLSQVIELGGKRARRMQVAARDRDTTAWQYEITRATVLKDLSQAFTAVVSAQQRVVLDDELLQLAEQVVSTVTARVDAGRVSPLELTKAKTALASARIQADRSRRSLESARTQLATFWGAKSAVFERAEGNFESVYPVPPLETLLDKIQQTPDLARWRAELEKREAVIALEKANAKPDVTVSAGFRGTGQPDRNIRGYSVGADAIASTSSQTKSDRDWDNSLVVGVSIPLPLFNRNQGAIKEAEHLAAKAVEERRSNDMQLTKSLHAAYQEVMAAQDAISTLKADIIPSATHTFESINEAYRQGKFGLLDVLDAQRTLFDAREQYISALTEFHTAAAELERLTGIALTGESDSQPAPTSQEK